MADIATPLSSLFFLMVLAGFKVRIDYVTDRRGRCKLSVRVEARFSRR